MKERFKFRVWNGKEMLYKGGLGYDGNQLIEDKGHIIMQSIGLKDVSGKLIYEYYVVRFGQEDEDIGIVMWNEDECKFVINEEFNKSLSDFSNWYGEDLEILGNIFEHDFFGKDTTAWLKASNIL